ncbi:MAG: PEGA domain-containing protein [Candidatus Sulfotelmatobacter sp.]|jgi:hypothetical protein
MSMRRMAALQAGLVLVAMFANATSRNDMIRIKVLDSDTRSLGLDDNGVPNNCEQLTFDAYCRSSRTPPVKSTLLVQEDNQPPFRISCTIESRNSRCTPLPKGATFDARKEKHGITVYYEDENGKARKQLYALVDADGKAGPPATATAVAAQPAPVAAAPRQSSPVTAPAPPARSVQEVPLEKVATVKCNFTSTPSGAEITVDGRYVGNTPSEIGVATGTHVVVLSLAGFAEWKRELTVAAGSGVVNVTADLQKTQP